MTKNESYVRFVRTEGTLSESLKEADQLARLLAEVLERPDIQDLIAAAHHVGASSHAIQETLRADMEALGFRSERKGLFSNFRVAGLRPDYFKELDEGGILFEVERGKTIANNMDLLDVWKTHICKEANHLFLLVPRIRETEKGVEQKILNTVTNRVGTFFQEGVQAIDVESVHIFGY